jgi:sugar phosphate isomerase/epimerase
VAQIGLMLYTVRDECARDLEGTLRATAELGYAGVEVFDLHGHEPSQVRAWLDELGLTAVSRHASLELIETRLPELAAEAKLLGTARVILSWLDPTTFASDGDADALAGRLARAAAAAAALGVELGFHNHDAEVRPGRDGRSFLDRLRELPLHFELDLGWVWWAGLDPVELLNELRGRSPVVHVKDFVTRGERSFCPVGDGNVGYERVAPAAVAVGVEWLLVEQDACDGSSLEAARRSFVSLTQMLEAS